VVTSSDIRILQALVNLEDKLKFLKKGEYVKSIDLGEYVVVLIKDGFEQVEIATLGKELSDAIGKRVKVIEYMSDLKKLIEQIIAPASLLGINKIWLPTGEEIVSVRISRRDRRFIAKNKDEYEELIEKISGIKARIVFE
jgi:hypothetical protein